MIFLSKKLQEKDFFTTFVAECELICQNLNCMESNQKWKMLHKWLINKYAITLLVSAVIFVFIGEQSLINQFSRSRTMRNMRASVAELRAKTAKEQALLQSLNVLDSLESFARETYFMHTDGEEVFIIEK